MSSTAPVIGLTVEKVATLQDIVKWAEIAQEMGVPIGSRVTVDGVHQAITVTAFLAQVPFPEGDLDA